MDVSLSEFKKNNSLLVWYSENEIKDLIIFLNKNSFYWKKEEKYYYNDEIKVLLEQEDLVNIINNSDFLFKKIKTTLEKSERRNNYIKDDIRIAGYFINFFIFFSILNFFLGWIFFHPVIWILLQLFLMLSFLVFIKLRRKIIRKINNKKNAC